MLLVRFFGPAADTPSAWPCAAARTTPPMHAPASVLGTVTASTAVAAGAGARALVRPRTLTVGPRGGLVNSTMRPSNTAELAESVPGDAEQQNAKAECEGA